MDPVETARSHDFPSSIDGRSKTFSNLEASLESGSIIAALEPVACTLLGRDFFTCVSEINRAESKDGGEQIEHLGLKLTTIQYLEKLIAIFTRCLQTSDIMNKDTLKQLKQTLPPVSMLRTACISTSTHLPMPMRAPTCL
jgi:hypothetical protein